MANRHKRKLASELISRFIAGEMTNDDFDAEVPRDPCDQALRAIYERLWFYWDDRKTHTLTGEHAPDAETHALFNRCISFLDSDCEYEWPPRLYVAPLWVVLLRTVGLGWAVERWEREALQRIRSFGDIEAWPYRRKPD